MSLALLVGAVAVVMTGTALATNYKAVDLISPDGAQETDRFGERTDTAHLTDDDGDGTVGDSGDTEDLFVAVFNHDTSTHTDVGRVYAMDGSDVQAGNDTALYRLDIPSGSAQDGANFGFFISVPGDVAGNGADDIVVGAPAVDVDVDGDGTLEGDVGKAWLFDGADGSLVRELANPDEQPGQRFGARIGRAGDLGGQNAKPEIVVGAPTTDVDVDGDGALEGNVGRAYVNDVEDSDGDGRADHLLTVDMPAADAEGGEQFGKHVQGPGDLGSVSSGEPSTTKDGTPDLFVNAFLDSYGTNPSAGRSYVLSGADADGDGVLDEDELLTRIDSPEPQPNALSAPEQESAFFGIQEVKPNAPGDVNGDGTPDLFGGAFRQDVRDDPAALDDDEGCNDPTEPTCLENEGKAWVFDGAASIEELDSPLGQNGVVVHDLNDPTETAGGAFGWSQSTTFHNADNTPDLYVGQIPHAHNPDEPLGGNGGTYVFDGANASVLKRLELPKECQQMSTSGNRAPGLGWTNSTFQDGIDGDQDPDYVAGAPWVDHNDTQDAGVVIFFGSNTKKNIDDC